MSSGPTRCRMAVTKDPSEMRGRRPGAYLLLALPLLLVVEEYARADIPEGLPRYALSIDLNTNEHVIHVRQLVTWTNCSQRVAGELVFNAHSHYQVPSGDVGFM